MRRGGALVAFGAMLLAPVFASVGPPPTLEQQIQRKLSKLPYYTVFDDLHYRVDNGTIILFGEVRDPVLKWDADKAVKSIEGAKVRDEIEVLPVSTMDDQIRIRTYRAIYGYGPLQHYGVGLQNLIHIIVKNGNVTLTGVVGTQSDSQMAYVRANSVPGVFSVKNDLTVTP